MTEIAVRVRALAVVLLPLAALGCDPGPAPGTLPGAAAVSVAAVDAGDAGDLQTPTIVVQPVAEAGAAGAAPAGGDAAADGSANADAGPAAADDASPPDDGSSDAMAVALCPDGSLACAGSCIDPQTDPSNCGACGRQCAPGTCVASACQPWVVATNVSPVAIACDGQDLAWSSVGLTQVLDVPVDGGDDAQAPAPTVLSGASSDSLGRITMAGSLVVWTTTDPSGQGTLWEASEDATIVGATVQSGLPAVAGLAVDARGGFAYVTSSSGGIVTLWRCDLSLAHPCSSLVSLSSSGIGGLVVDDTDVYWTDPGNANVSRYRFADGSVTVVAYNQPGLGPLALDAANVYWVSNGAGGFTVNRMSKGSPGSSDVVATGRGASRAVVSDGRNVYVGTASALVEAAPIEGGVPLQPIAPTGAGPVDQLAYAAGALYWADNYAATIYGLRVEGALLKAR